MKTKVFAIISLFFGVLFGNAQSINGGLIGGLSVSQVDGDQMGGYNQFGLCAGAFLEFPMQNNFAFQPELRFCQKGSTGYLDNAYLSGRLNYVEIPLLFNWQYKKVKLETGLVPAILVDMVSSTNVEMDGFKTIDWGFAGGLSYLATETLRFNIRYTHTVPLIARYENNCVTLALFYYLKNGKKE